MIDEELDLQHCTFHEVGYSFEFSYYYVNFMENYFSSQWKEKSLEQMKTV